MPALAARGISKRFGSVAALDGVSIEVRPGEVHALLGENGAGKTTLVKILAGLIPPDSGEVLHDGKRVVLRSPRDAAALGIGMVHQHQMLVPTLTVAENLSLAKRSERGVLLRPDRAWNDSRELAATLGVELDPGARVGELPVGVAQRVEILKVLANDVTTLILDEPTAVLAPNEIAGLLDTLARLAGSGVSVVFVTHKIGEAAQIANRVTVLRRGRVEAAGDARGGIDRDALTRAIMGDAADTRPSSRGRPSQEVDVRVRNLIAGAQPPGADRGRGRRTLDEISFDLHAGEILGVAGVDGNGQSELARVVAGIEGPESGSVEASRAIAFIPGDRTREGLIQEMSLWENLSLGVHRDPAFTTPGPARIGRLLDVRRLRDRAAEVVRRFDIRAGGLDAPARTLSGGNQQKVVLARELSRGADVLVALNPTRGLDLAATGFVHDVLRSLRAAGGSVLLISSDLDEILALADRIGVLYRGRLRLVPPGEGSVARIGELMLGGA